MSKREFAQRAGVDKEVITNVEEGRSISRRSARKLLEMLSVEFNQELTFSDVEGLNVQGLKPREQAVSRAEPIAENREEMIAKIKADAIRLCEIIAAIPEGTERTNVIGMVAGIARDIIGRPLIEELQLPLPPPPHMEQSPIERTKTAPYTAAHITRVLKAKVKTETD